jgi:L-threonylcarbamoyladenylate synthase
MKYRHYAPKAPVTVVIGAPKKSAQEILERITPTAGVICFDEFAELFAGHEVHTLGQAADKTTQAQRVFDALRTFDDSGVSEIFAQCPDNRGLGLAVSNRLKKAAGFHVIDADDDDVCIGITGGTGAGKTSALRAFASLGGKVLDCDRIYAELLISSEALRHELVAAFGGVFLPDGSLDREKLSGIVFGNKEKLDKLDAIAFRFVRPELQRRMEADPGRLYAIDAINLIESGLDQNCDRTVAVTAPVELRVRRIMARDGIDEQRARMRVSAQKADDYYREKCDAILENDVDTPEAFEREARLYFEKLIERIKEEKRHGAVQA